MPGQAPVKTYRVGYVSASIFKRQIEPKNGGQKRSVHSVSLQKSYLDGEGTRQYTGNLDLGDLPAATTVLDLATKFIVEQEADVTP